MFNLSIHQSTSFSINQSFPNLPIFSWSLFIVSFSVSILSSSKPASPQCWTKSWKFPQFYWKSFLLKFSLESKILRYQTKPFLVLRRLVNNKSTRKVNQIKIRKYLCNLWLFSEVMFYSTNNLSLLHFVCFMFK